jgi:hypothetical protein
MPSRTGRLATRTTARRTLGAAKAGDAGDAGDAAGANGVDDVDEVEDVDGVDEADDTADAVAAPGAVRAAASPAPVPAACAAPGVGCCADACPDRSHDKPSASTTITCFNHSPNIAGPPSRIDCGTA